MDIQEKFFEKFNSGFAVLVPGRNTYNVRKPNPEFEKWQEAERKAQETLTDEELEKWYEEHDDEYQDPEIGDARFIPDDENWALVAELMKESLEQGKDLLWERWGKNIIERDPNVLY